MPARPDARPAAWSLEGIHAIEAGLSLMPVLPPDEAVTLLRGRALHLSARSGRCKANSANWPGRTLARSRARICWRHSRGTNSAAVRDRERAPPCDGEGRA